MKISIFDGIKRLKEEKKEVSKQRYKAPIKKTRTNKADKDLRYKTDYKLAL